ncbi:MAG: tRNA (5-methylaminomethyl-2-thiouridylate)-methyltransferase [Symbiobacteriaceae bacterium]|jgi:tRNA-specific 2-thiouridylase|nr:tRNA (5-methylaminomethyl-2-thiouridylate)-methyltransferase [Symbiobacteriaceae bacterium]
MNKRVLMAMSGGVDSSVAAAILVEQGYEVIGVTMNTWTDDIPEEIQMNQHSGCCSLAAVEDARAVANRLGVPFYVMNFQGHFAATVIDYFVDEYARGRTPNPCIACNRYVKFDAFLTKARQLECDYVATGHYAVIGRDSERFPGRVLLGKSDDARKDQTYVLHNLTQDALTHTLFPVGDMEKPAVRELGRKYGLLTADKPDSQEICFVYDDDYGRFLKERIPEAIKPGPMLNTRGEVIGEHQGLPLYTVGQRKGLGLTTPRPMYVVALDPERNAVIVGEDEATYQGALVASDMNWIALPGLTGPIRCTAKIRRMAAEAACTVHPLDGGAIRVEFDEPQRAITPGQSVVLYEGRWVLGGGTIDKAE